MPFHNSWLLLAYATARGLTGHMLVGLLNGHSEILPPDASKPFNHQMAYVSCCQCPQVRHLLSVTRHSSIAAHACRCISSPLLHICLSGALGLQAHEEGVAARCGSSCQCCSEGGPRLSHAFWLQDIAGVDLENDLPARKKAERCEQLVAADETHMLRSRLQHGQ
jgi:hypothetical protein